MADQSNSEQSKAVVDANYQAGVQRRLTDFAQYALDRKERQGHLDLGRYFEPQTLLDQARHRTRRYAPIQRTYGHDRTHSPDRADAVGRG